MQLNLRSGSGIYTTGSKPRDKIKLESFPIPHLMWELLAMGLFFLRRALAGLNLMKVIWEGEAAVSKKFFCLSYVLVQTLVERNIISYALCMDSSDS